MELGKYDIDTRLSKPGERKPRILSLREFCANKIRSNLNLYRRALLLIAFRLLRRPNGLLAMTYWSVELPPTPIPMSQDYSCDHF